MKIAATSRLVPTELPGADTSDSTVTRIGAPKPENRRVTARYPTPAIVTSPCAGIAARTAPDSVLASVCRPSDTITPTPGPASSRAYCAAVSSEATTVTEAPPRGSRIVTSPGATAARLPRLTIRWVPELTVSRASPEPSSSDTRRSLISERGTPSSARPTVCASARASVLSAS